MVMLPVYLLTSLPAYLMAQAQASVQEVSRAVAESFEPSPAIVHVNRTLPAGVMNDNAPDAQAAGTPVRLLSATSTDAEFFQAGIFAEPLVPTGGPVVKSENEALADALKAFSQSGNKPGDDAADQAAPIKKFLAEHPGSRWGLALWLNLGLTYRRAGYWTRALDAWEQAWIAGKMATTPNARALADRAVAELAELNARLGRFERLQPLFEELDASGRKLRGTASEKLAGARQGLWMMDHEPQISFRCGPMALNCLRLAENPNAPLEEKIFGAQSTRQGISLSQVAALSREIKRPMQMAYRAADKAGKGADFITPAVVHWSAGHYAALVEEKNGRYRVDDPTFGDTIWVSKKALEAETDGYFLVSESVSLPAGWKVVSEDKGGKVWGKGTTGSKDPNATRCKDLRVKDCPQCTPGMATANVQAMLTSLAIGDMPLSYAPPRGYPIQFSVQYSQHEASQPAVFTAWNLGPKWTSQWLCYIEDNECAQWVYGGTSGWYQTRGIFTGPPPVLHLPGGGLESYPVYTQISLGSPHYPGPEPIYFSYASAEQTPTYKIVDTPPDGYGNIGHAPVLVHPRLVQTDNGVYKRYLPDGSIEVFGNAAHSSTAINQGQPPGGYVRRLFLTARKDPSGNTTSFSYDASHRLLAVTDALGQVTTLSYDLAGDPLKVTRVTDPFGRSCQLTYNSDGQLASITDTAGIQSSFTYASGSDFINALTTPYGTTTFSFGDVTTDPSLGIRAWLETTDPYGDTERAEFRHDAPGIPYSESVVPQTIPTFNAYINARNTYYWDKKAYKEAKGTDGSFDYTKARIMHFLHSADINVCSGVLESTKEPLENRVWRAYQGQSWASGVSPGMSQQPSIVARVLDDGSTQLYRYEYNDQQRVTKSTDPLGRETTYTYDADNGVDLKEVAITTGGTLHERLSAVDHYNAAHQPLEIYDAAGQKTTMTYNGFGQVETITDAAQRTATMHYDGQGYLQEIVGFDPAIKSTYTYDGYGRISSTTTYPDAYTLQVGYDAVGGNPLATLNRSTTVTHPDGSYTEIDYKHLDVEWKRDRSGHWTHLLTNKLRQVEASIDPLGQVTQYGYCKCGQLVSLVDPNGNVTRWKLDAQARPAAKVYADNTEVAYTYENTTSRLKRVTDAKGQHTNYTYNLDGALQGVTYTNAEHSTPGVSYTYDPLRGRLATMQDGIGTTTYAYYPYGNNDFGSVGAGRVQSVSGPFANQVVAYEYDALGRTTKHSLNGVAETYAFDALGRLQTDTNALGAFTYSYDGVTSRLTGIAYSNGQQAQYSYLPGNTQERRLSQIKHFTPQGTTLDQFDYTYDGPSGRISRWEQQQPGSTVGSTATNNYDLSYDAVGRLRRAVLNGDGNNPGSSVWRYDDAGNRVGVQTGSGTLSTATFTPTNALFSLRGGGRVRVAGSSSEWAQVSVNGKSARLEASSNTFEAFVPVTTGTQTLSINATDASGNTAARSYQLTISAGMEEDFGYDANGNSIALTPTAAGSVPQTLEWDACDRVSAIVQGSHRTEFGYDGQGARVQIKEVEAGQVTSDRLYVAGEERDAATGQALRRFFGQGEQRLAGGGSTASSFFYAGDHLGSTRALTDGSGSLRASYGYDLWGARTKLRGDLDTEMGFTGYWHHPQSGLEISPTRIYNSHIGLFASRDPIGFSGGINLYCYVGNDPVNRNDPSGLAPVVVTTLAGPYLNSPAAIGGTATAATGGGVATTFGAIVLPALAVAAWTPAGQKWIAHNIVDPWLDIIQPLSNKGYDREWGDARERYWKHRADTAEEDEFSDSDLARMRAGLAPIDQDTGAKKELHHVKPKCEGGSNDPSNLLEVWPWEHDDIDPYRYYRGPAPDGWKPSK